MKVFKYEIYKEHKLVLTNWINTESKEKAIADLQDLKEEYDGTDLKVIEVCPASKWKC